jgi:hypothetical protein
MSQKGKYGMPCSTPFFNADSKAGQSPFERVMKSVWSQGIFRVDVFAGQLAVQKLESG